MRKKVREKLGVQLGFQVRGGQWRDVWHGSIGHDRAYDITCTIGTLSIITPFISSLLLQYTDVMEVLIEVSEIL